MQTNYYTPEEYLIVVEKDISLIDTTIRAQLGDDGALTDHEKTLITLGFGLGCNFVLERVRASLGS